ncbi:hypothetical protein CRUP_019782, partial [Coryphaenoides rupestris]
MARGEGAEQYSATSLLPVKPLSADGIQMEKKTKEQRKPLSVCSKLCYAVGGAPYQITGSALGFFLQIYLLDVAQLEPFYASIILFVGRAWDAVTDPTVGFLVSRSKWTRFGRMMPWVLLSTPFAVMSYFLIWYVPAVEQGKVLWYLVFYCLFQSLQTCFHVPYSSLTMFISSEQSERDSATAYRMTVEVLGSVIGTAIQGQIVGGAIAPCIPTEYDLDRYGNKSGPQRNITRSLDETKEAYMIASGVICCIYVLCAAVLFMGVKEQKVMMMCYKRSSSAVNDLISSPFCTQLLEGNFALFLTYALGHRDDFQNILLVIMLSGTVSIPFWQWFLMRYGKKMAVYFGITWAVPFMILIVCIESNLIISYLVSVAAGISVAAAYLLPWSMLPDVVDDFKVKNPDIHGYEAIFFSFYVFFTKFAAGVFAGYVTRGCSQPESVILTLKVLVSPVPVALIVLGLLIFKTYPIDEEQRQRNRKLLQELLEPEDSETDSTKLGSVVHVEPRSPPHVASVPDVSVTCSASDFEVRVKSDFYGLGANSDELRLGTTCPSNGRLVARGDLLFTYRLTECDVQHTWTVPAKSQVYDLGQMVNVQVSASHLPPGGQVYTSSCFATPYNGSKPPLRYTLIDNFGCMLMSQKDLGGSGFVSSLDDHTLRFSFSAFQFTSDPNAQVQIQCKFHASSEGPNAVYKACNHKDNNGPILVSDQPVTSEDHFPSATLPLVSTTAEGELEEVFASETGMNQPITEQGGLVTASHFTTSGKEDQPSSTTASSSSEDSTEDEEAEKELEGDASVWVEGVKAVGQLNKLGFGSGLITKQWEGEMSGMGDLVELGDGGGLQYGVTEGLLEAEGRDPELGSTDSSEAKQTVPEDEPHKVSGERLGLRLSGEEEVATSVTLAQRETSAAWEQGTTHWAEGGRGRTEQPPAGGGEVVVVEEEE